MASTKQKLKATQFICERLEDSGLYVILNKDHEHVSVTQRANLYEKPRDIEVIIPNFLGNIKNFTDRLKNNSHNNKYTASVLYKDGKTAFVRMVERNISWRKDKSLKKYTPQEINRMLHLRGIEKKVIEYFGKEIIYFQPQTERLQESLREFYLEEVELDYSHLSSNDQSYVFVKNHISIDYKIPQETRTIEPAAEFSFIKDHSYYLKAKIKPCASDIEIDLREMAADAYPDLDPEEAYHKFRPED
ncbi:MAG: hypothetical protein ABH824_05990 [Nanoarchaeota archaeon]|nr:hypothetical protein [Nanoarchaeota archaeon]MBU1631792.1 hypothetical protein [Nanoarchaeota archaeon]MBU1876019.1 hypothetical protein [Nanoarchaeota archaeon]